MKGEELGKSDRRFSNVLILKKKKKKKKKKKNLFL